MHRETDRHTGSKMHREKTDRQTDRQSHHAGALTVADVWVEPGQASENPSEARNSHTIQSTETGVSGHGAQKILLYLWRTHTSSIIQGTGEAV